MKNAGEWYRRQDFNRKEVNDLWKQEKQHKTVCDKGKSHPMKKEDFHLDKATAVEVKKPEWLIPGYIPKYGITTIAGEGD